MTRGRSSQICSRLVFLAACWTVLASSAAPQRAGDAAVLKFYWERARAAVSTGDPIEHGVRFSYEATTYYKRIGKLGSVRLEDSLKEIQFYSFGNLDSSRVVIAAKKKSLKADLSVPRVFDSSYVLNFFPNDTGGPDIAVGFVADSAHIGLPDGLAILDRQIYCPVWLYVSYPHKKGYRHFSRSFRFTQKDGFIFPDSVWEVGVVDGLFSTRSYRVETGVTNLIVYR